MKSTFDGVSPLRRQLAIGRHVVPEAVNALEVTQA
jgi:hypothetical protein